MTPVDKYMIILMFQCLVKILFAVLYSVTNRKDDDLFEYYKTLLIQLKEWEMGQYEKP